jgi:hypothetical protein
MIVQVSYGVYLGLFSYVILVELDEGRPYFAECFLYAWTATMIMEEVRQVLCISSTINRILLLFLC